MEDTMKSFGNLKHRPLREIWPNEASSFTPWLSEHITDLGQTLGLELELQEREADVGEFSLDLLVKDLGTNKNVVIENQITGTDHDHLGKLLTYASGFEASIVIWIAETIREEHRQALEWLNDRTDEETAFYGVTVEVLQIDESLPAFKFNPVVFPNEWKRTTSRTSSSQHSPKMKKYRDYFQQLIDVLRQKHQFTNAKRGQPQNWYSFSTGVTGFVYGVSFALNSKVRVDFYIDIGDTDGNKRIFDKIYADKAEIEAAFGEPLSWERLDEKRSSRIAIYRQGSIEADENTLNEIREWSVQNLLKLKNIFGDRLKKYVDTDN